MAVNMQLFILFIGEIGARAAENFKGGKRNKKGKGETVECDCSLDALLTWLPCFSVCSIVVGICFLVPGIIWVVNG